MTKSANGTFDVQIKPVDQTAQSQAATPGRMLLDKQFHGDLQATGKGQMLTALTSIDGSAGYVAIEEVTGILNGRNGSFVLQHSGIMSRGEQQLAITIVPDSGTGELTGIAGNMIIAIDENGRHTYTLHYEIPDL
ncbi:MAG: DUF3224 domain-containing protein [Anaerolineales bacterium]|nr:DUF3224 domain-containing protein [Anaerolineales bacterium]